jgi:hypothetical protein
MQITLKSGEQYSGTPRQIVTALRDGSWTASRYADNVDYKRAVARRIQKWSGRDVRTAFDADFLTDLHRLGFIPQLHR